MKSGVKKSGFTIVELLIVVVIIAILASIIVVAYNGIQTQATNTRSTSVTSMYYRALVTYSQKNGSYPPLPAGVGGTCLGVGYADRNSDGVGDCGESAYPLSEQPVFNNALKTLITSTPKVNDKPVNMPYQSTSWIGASYHYYPPNPSDPVIHNQAGFTVDGISTPYYLMFALEKPNANCGVKIIIPDEVNYGWPKMTANVPEGRTYSWTDGRTSVCVVSLPNL